MAYFDFLNIIFAPLLKLPVALAVIILAFIVSSIVIIITKYTTDQSLMKKLKDDMKEHQKRVKELKHEPAKAMEAQKKAMEVNMQYLTHSLKPTLITLIPIIFIFAWANSHFAYESIKPGQEFSVTAFFEKNINGNTELIAQDGLGIIGAKSQKIENSQAAWKLKGEEGEHVLEFVYDGEKRQHNVLISSGSKYLAPAKKFDGAIKLIQIGYKSKKILNLFGLKLSWIWTYIILSIIFTTVLRKLLKVY